MMILVSSSYICMNDGVAHMRWYIQLTTCYLKQIDQGN